MTEQDEVKQQVVRSVERYRPLQLIANPFAVDPDTSDQPAISLEINAEANKLLAALDAAANEEKPKPMWVSKADVPSFYPLRAVAEVEGSLAQDDDLNLLHGYIQLYMLRVGRVRATLNVLAERLAFRGFDKTLAAWVRQVLAEPDAQLASYQVVAPEALEEFSAAFAEDEIAALAEVFGPFEMERKPEWSVVADNRHMDLEADVDEPETDAAEIDETIRDAPGVGLAARTTEGAEEQEAQEEAEEPEPFAGVLDYLIEYASEHLSVAIARGLRVLHERGIIAMATEFRITKAPRKTLGGLIRLARMRFRNVVIIYDGFENWAMIEPDIRSQIIAAFSEIRWLLDGLAMMVFIAEHDAAPELEEQFGHANRLHWGFEDLSEIFENPDDLRDETIDRWLAAAALPGGAAVTLEDPVLARLHERANGDAPSFFAMAAAAVEDAADRRVSALDEQAFQAGVASDSESG